MRRGTSSQSVGISSAKEWVETNQVELYWQDDLGQYYGEMEKDGVNYEIWMEEERSPGTEDAADSGQWPGGCCLLAPLAWNLQMSGIS